MTDKDDVESFGLRTAGCKRIGRQVEPDGLVSQRRQFFLVPDQPIPLAFDDQNRLAAPEGAHRPLIHRQATGCDRRKPYVDATSTPGLALHADRSIMITDDFPNGGKAQTSPGQTGREKWFENSPCHALIKAAPGIAHRKA